MVPNENTNENKKKKLNIQTKRFKIPWDDVKKAEHHKLKIET